MQRAGRRALGTALRLSQGSDGASPAAAFWAAPPAAAATLDRSRGDKFVDWLRVTAVAGSGGAGSTSFWHRANRRGVDGGSGGRGGDVVLMVRPLRRPILGSSWLRLPQRGRKPRRECAPPAGFRLGEVSRRAADYPEGGLRRPRRRPSTCGEARPRSAGSGAGGHPRLAPRAGRQRQRRRGARRGAALTAQRHWRRRAAAGTGHGLRGRLPRSAGRAAARRL